MAEDSSEASPSSEKTSGGGDASGDGAANSKAFEPQLSERELRKIRYYEAMFAKMAMEERQRAAGGGASLSAEGGAAKRRALSSLSSTAAATAAAAGGGGGSSGAENEKTKATSSSVAAAPPPAASVPSSSKASTTAGGEASAASKRKHARVAAESEEDSRPPAKRASPAGAGAAAVGGTSSAKTLSQAASKAGAAGGGAVSAFSASGNSGRRTNASSKTAAAAAASAKAEETTPSSSNASLPLSAAGSELSDQSEETTTRSVGGAASPPASASSRRALSAAVALNGNANSAAGAAGSGAKASASKTEKTRGGGPDGVSNVSNGVSLQSGAGGSGGAGSASTAARSPAAGDSKRKGSSRTREGAGGAGCRVATLNAASSASQSGDVCAQATTPSRGGTASNKKTSAGEAGGGASNGDASQPSRSSSAARGSLRLASSSGQGVGSGGKSFVSDEKGLTKNASSAPATHPQRSRLAVADSALSAALKAETGEGALGCKAGRSPPLLLAAKEEDEALLPPSVSSEASTEKRSRTSTDRKAERRAAPRESAANGQSLAAAEGASLRRTQQSLHAFDGADASASGSAAARDRNGAAANGAESSEGGGVGSAASLTGRQLRSETRRGLSGAVFSAESDGVDGGGVSRRCSSRVLPSTNATSNGGVAESAERRGPALRREGIHPTRGGSSSAVANGGPSNSGSSAVPPPTSPVSHSVSLQAQHLATPALDLLHGGSLSGGGGAAASEQSLSFSNSQTQRLAAGLLSDSRAEALLQMRTCSNGGAALGNSSGGRGGLRASWQQPRLLQEIATETGVNSSASPSPASPKAAGGGRANSSNVSAEFNSLTLGALQSCEQRHLRSPGAPPAAVAGGRASLATALLRDAEERARETRIFIRNLKTLGAVSAEAAAPSTASSVQQAEKPQTSGSAAAGAEAPNAEACEEDETAQEQEQEQEHLQQQQSLEAAEEERSSAQRSDSGEKRPGKSASPCKSGAVEAGSLRRLREGEGEEVLPRRDWRGLLLGEKEESSGKELQQSTSSSAHNPTQPMLPAAPLEKEKDSPELGEEQGTGDRKSHPPTEEATSPSERQSLAAALAEEKGRQAQGGGFDRSDPSPLCTLLTAVSASGEAETLGGKRPLHTPGENDQETTAAVSGAATGASQRQTAKSDDGASVSERKPSLKALLREISWKGRLLRRACGAATKDATSRAMKPSVSGLPPG